MGALSVSGGEIWEWFKNGLAILSAAGITLSAVVLAAYGLFKVWGAKWLDSKFAAQLEAYKAEQARELERLRHKINSAFDRTKRLHDREYEILPDVWQKLVEAKRWVDSYLAPYQEYSDVRRMDNLELEAFLADARFSDVQRREVRDSIDRQRAYVRLYEIRRSFDVMDRIREASISLSKNGIFVVPALRDDMKRYIDLAAAAVLEKQTNHEQKPPGRMKDEVEKLKHEGNPLFASIETAVAARLWDTTNGEV
jgi:hypothetical protein